jgi:hypothetical protein
VFALARASPEAFGKPNTHETGPLAETGCGVPSQLSRIGLTPYSLPDYTIRLMPAMQSRSLHQQTMALMHSDT